MLARLHYPESLSNHEMPLRHKDESPIAAPWQLAAGYRPTD
jgi:hypothetical protein